MKKEHEEFLVKVFQAQHNEDISWFKLGDTGFKSHGDNERLAIDGVYGPKTAAEIDKYLPSPDIMKDVWDFAITCVGKGGDGVKNNEGDWLEAIRANTNLYKLGMGSWCQVFVSYTFLGMGLEVYNSVRHRSCTKAYEQMVESGLWEELDDASDMRVGEVCVGFYGRGNLSGKRHVRLVRRTGEMCWRHVGGNESGDKVCSQSSVEAGIERRMTCLMRLKA